MHSQCGVVNWNFPDNFMNEEWWGLLSVQAGCSTGNVDRLTPRLAYHQVATYTRVGSGNSSQRAQS